MQGSRRHPPTWAASMGLLAAMLLFAAFSGPPAEAKVPKNSVAKLRRAPCPPAYNVRVARNADFEEVQQAKRGIFKIAGQNVEITRKFDWTYDPIGSASFRARLHDLRWLDPLLYAYRTNGDRSALRRAKRIVVDWVKSNPRQRPSTDRTWFDKVAGDRIAYIAYVTRAARCAGMLSNKRLARKLLSSVDEHSDFLTPDAAYPVTNRGLFVDMGLILAGKEMRFLPGANKRRKQATRRFLGTVNELTDFEEGFWLEHSTTYQFLTIGVIERFLEVEKRQRPALEQLLANMEDTAAWLVEPDDRWLQAGNSYQDRANRVTRRLAKKKRGLRVLPESGLGFVRKKNEYLSFLADFHGPTHKHSDELSFDLTEGGSRLISDTGLPTKDPTRAYEFAVSAQAHNTITVDGVDFPRDAASAYGSGITASGEGDGWFAIEARNPLVERQGVEHSRTLIYRPGFALIVADRVRSSEPHSYRRYLQFGPDWNLNFLPEKLELENRDGSFSVSSYSSVPEERHTVRGRKDPFQGFVFPDFQERDNRATAWFSAETMSFDSVMTIATNPEREAKVVPSDELGDANDVFAISENGEPTRVLSLTRSGETISITQDKLKGPAEPGDEASPSAPSRLRPAAARLSADAVAPSRRRLWA